MNRVLEILRIAVSLIVFTILGLGLSWSVWAVPVAFQWLTDIQLGWAITAMSLTIFAVWMLITLIFGRVYCSSVCPMGTMMDISSRIRRQLSHNGGKVYRYSPPNNPVRYATLTITVICVIIGFSLIPGILDPFSDFRRICHDFFNPLVNWAAGLLSSIGITGSHARYAANVSVISSIVASFIFTVVMIISAQSGRTLCNTVCPIGTILSFVSRYSIFQINIDTDKCTQCRRCEYVCRAHCIDLSDHVVDTSRCVNCFSCLNACRDDAIHYTTDRKRLSQPLMQRITGIAKQPDTEATISASDSQINPNDKLTKQSK